MCKKLKALPLKKAKKSKIQTDLRLRRLIPRSQRLGLFEDLSRSSEFPIDRVSLSQKTELSRICLSLFHIRNGFLCISQFKAGTTKIHQKKGLFLFVLSLHCQGECLFKQTL